MIYDVIVGSYGYSIFVIYNPIELLNVLHVSTIEG
jgi:hypothetical protein